MYLRSVLKLRVISFGAATLLTIVLAGCSAKDLALDDSFTAYGPSERYPIQYAKGPVTLNVDARKGTLKQAQVEAIAGFARQSKARGQSPVTVSRPSGGGSKASDVATEIAGLLIGHGVPRNMIHLKSYHAGASAPVRVAYVKAYAHTKACGEWDENLADTSSNERFNVS